MVHDEKPGSCMSLPVKARYVFSGTKDDLDHPERVVISFCMGTGEGPVHTVSEFMEEFRLHDHIASHAGLMARFVEHLGGIEESNRLKELNLMLADWDVRRRVREFTEREYRIKV